MMLHIYQWPSHGKLPNSGVFCMKLESYLRFMKMEHKIISTTNLGKSPKKTMPYAEIDGQLMSDSRLIIEKLDTQSSQPIDGHLNAEQKSISTAYTALLENHLVPIIIYFRWFKDSGWDQFSRMIFSGAPTVIRVLIGGLMRKGTLKSLYANGISRHSETEIISFAKQDIQSLAELLGNKDYVFGDKVSLLDLVLFSVVSNILHGKVEMPLISIVEKYPTLRAHSDRMMKLLYKTSFAE